MPRAPSVLERVFSDAILRDSSFARFISADRRLRSRPVGGSRRHRQILRRLLQHPVQSSGASRRRVVATAYLGQHHRRRQLPQRQGVQARVGTRGFRFKVDFERQQVRRHLVGDAVSVASWEQSNKSHCYEGRR